MRMYDIIVKTRDGGRLTEDEIRYIIAGYTAGEIPDYQMAAWCMAVYFRGLDREMTAALTQAMVDSGEVLSWPELPGRVDKHSTGGVGDKTTLVLAPWVAAAGVPMAKMSGRGLGHTGGTLDKLSAIPGFRTELTREEFLRVVQKVGVAIVGQTGNLTPADKKLYSLRDVTATVDSIPLIASSIMSKKIAAGADYIVLDVKVGNGAFMRDLSSADELARTMVDIGERMGKKTVALLTDMNQPLGRAVGNALEVREAIEALQGKGPRDLMELCLVLGAEILVLVGKAKTADRARSLLEKVLETGAALQKFQDMIEAQGGDKGVVDEPERLSSAPVIVEYTAPRAGYITAIPAREIGRIAMELGAGRERKEDDIDLTVGLEVLYKVGDYIRQGQPLIRIHSSSLEAARRAQQRLGSFIGIGENPPATRPLVLARVASNSPSPNR